MFYITTEDGTKIAVYEYQPCCGKTIVLVHGWPLSHKMYEYQIPMLAKMGYRIIAVDLRGYGKSDTPICGYDYDTMASDLYCVVRSLNLRCFVLAGFSMGGAICLRYMKNYREYGVKKLFLLAAAAPSWTQRQGYPYGLSRTYVNQLICQASTDRPQLARDFSHKQLFSSIHSEAVKEWFEDIALSASGIATVQSAVALRDEDGRKDLSAVTVPTVIIHGNNDVVVSDDLARIQHRGIQNSCRYTLENSGHGIIYDELENFNKIFASELP